MVVDSNEARQELPGDFGYSRRPFWSFRMSDWRKFTDELPVPIAGIMIPRQFPKNAAVLGSNHERTRQPAGKHSLPDNCRRQSRDGIPKHQVTPVNAGCPAAASDPPLTGVGMCRERPALSLMPHPKLTLWSYMSPGKSCADLPRLRNPKVFPGFSLSAGPIRVERVKSLCMVLRSRCKALNVPASCVIGVSSIC